MTEGGPRDQYALRRGVVGRHESGRPSAIRKPFRRCHRSVSSTGQAHPRRRAGGWFLRRAIHTQSGDLVGTTQHETMDEAMEQVYSEYNAISEWRLCPDG